MPDLWHTELAPCIIPNSKNDGVGVEVVVPIHVKDFA
jgi:hypothetical protein